MPASLIEYRLTIRNASTVANPDGTADEVVVTSVPSGTNPYIAAAPSGDGQEVDPIMGGLRTGAYTVQIVDANTGTDATGTVRVLTNKLEDATFRQQLISRRAYLETRTDGGAWQSLVAGYVAGVRLVSPIRYEVTVGDTRRVERTQTIFQGGALGAYTTRGCITGGPITANWGPIRARGGWRYRLAVSGNDVVATFVDGYEPGQDAPIVTDWRRVASQQIAQAIETRRQVNPYALGGGSEYVTSYTTPVYDATTNDWAIGGGVVAWVGSTATNAAPVRALVVGSAVTPSNEFLGVSKLYLYWPGCPYSTGQVVWVSLTTFETTTQTPLYIDAHPVDLVTAIWTNARIRYNPAAAWVANVRALIGDSVRIACRFAEPPTIAEFLEKSIFGPFGISARTNAAGEQELFATRIRLSTTPALTIGTNDLRSADPLVFDLDEQTAISAVTLKQQVFNPAPYNAPTNVTSSEVQASQGRVPQDGVLVSAIEQTAQYVDPNLTVFTGRNVTYDVPGMIHTALDWTPATTEQLDAISVALFDRYGRGCQTSEAAVLAGSAAAAAQVGDELYYDVAHFPNKGYRIGESSVGARIMQVVRRTETPAGPVFKLLDSGLAAQPAQVPTIALQQNPNAPSSIAQFQITNAATLNATPNLGVRVEWGTGPTPPAGGADFSFYWPGQIPGFWIDYPAVQNPGTVVWARARSEQAGRRPSAWTAWISVTLALVPAPVSLMSSDLKQTAVTLTWANTSTVYPLAVFAFQGSSAPASWTPYRVGTLPVGSTSTIVRNLTGPGVAWTLAVAYETPNGLGAFATTTVTTNTTLDTTTRPAGLAVIPGLDDATLTQGIALALWASDPTLDIVIERSPTGTTGFVEVARVSGSTTVYVDERPRDGQTWYYRIAHALGGFAVTAYTREVSAIAKGVPPNLVRPDAVTPTVQVETTETATTATVTLTVTDPQGRVDQVRFRERTGGGAWSAWTVDATVPYSYSATVPGTGFVDIQYEVNGFTSSGEYGLLAGGTESFDRNATADMVSVVGSFSSAGALTLAFSADTDTASIKFATSTVSQPTLATVQAQTAINARNHTATLAGPFSANTVVYVSVLAYTAINGGGTESGLFEYNIRRDSGLIYTQCQAVAVTTSTATIIQAFVTGTSPIGTPTVQLVSVTGSAVQIGGPAPGVPAPSGTFYTFTRGAALGPTGGALFRSVLSGAVSDDDFLEIPEQGRDTIYLLARARVTATTNQTVTIRVAVADPYPTVNVATISGNLVTTATAHGRTGTWEVVIAGNSNPLYNGTWTATFNNATSFTIPFSSLIDGTGGTATTRASIGYSTTGLLTPTQTDGSPLPATIWVTPDATLTEAAGTFYDFLVTRPVAGAGAGRITFTAASNNRLVDSDAVDVPPQDTAMMSISAAFNEVGTQATVFFVGDTTVNSFKFATSTSAFPTLATVQAASPINARNSTQTVNGSFALGTTLYVSCVAYTGTNATGRESPIFQMAFRRQNTTPTVKNRQPGSAVCYATTPNTSWGRTLGYYIPGYITTGTTNQQGEHHAQVIVPRGVTLRAIRVNCYALAGSDIISINFYRVTTNGSFQFLGSTQQNIGAGWQTLAVTSLTEDTTDRSYYVQIFANWATITASSDLRVAWVEAEYDKPDTDANI